MVKIMFCKHCGKQLPDNSTFCTGCGTQLQAQPTAQPVAQPAAQPVAAPAQPVAAPAQPAQTTTAYAAPEYDAAPVTHVNDGAFAQVDFGSEVPPKKKKKKKAILLSSIALVLVAAITLSLFLIFRKEDSLMSTFVETINTLNSNVEMSEKGKALANLYGAMLESSETGSQIDMSLDASDTVVGMLESVAGVDLAWLKETNISFRYDLSEEIGTMGATVEIDGDNIIDVETIIDTTTNSIFFGIPEWTDTYLYQRFDTDDTEAGQFFEMYKTMIASGGATEFLPTGDDIAGIIDNYADIIDECFKSDSEADITLTVGGIQQDVTMYTMDITERELMTAAVEILEKAKDDQDIIDVIQKVADFYAEQNMISVADADMLESSYIEAVTTAYLEVQEALGDASNETLFTLVRYVDDDNMIVGRDLSVDGESYLYHATATDGDVYAFILEAEGVSIDGEGTIDGNAKTGTYTVYQGDEEVMEFKLNGFALDDYGPNGSIIFYPPAEYMDDMSDNTMVSSLLSGMKVGFEIAFESEKSSFGVKLNVLTGSDVLIGCSLKISDYSGSGTTPENSVSVENIDRWINTIDTQKIIEELSDTAIGELVDMFMGDLGDLGGLMGGGLFDYDLDDYGDVYDYDYDIYDDFDW